MVGTEEDGPGGQGPTARNRMKGLRERRSAAQAAPQIKPLAAPSRDEVAGGKKRGAAALLSGSSDASKRKALSRVYKILSETPADATGMVEGTPFSKAGVRTLVETLRKRQADPAASGAKMAARIFQFMTAKGKASEEAVPNIHGIPIYRLEQLARTADALRRRGRM
jgi:hypothetical protein